VTYYKLVSNNGYLNWSAIGAGRTIRRKPATNSNVAFTKTMTMQILRIVLALGGMS
jgi:hypothetical protein